MHQSPTNLTHARTNTRYSGIRRTSGKEITKHPSLCKYRHDVFTSPTKAMPTIAVQTINTLRTSIQTNSERKINQKKKSSKY